MYYIIIN